MQCSLSVTEYFTLLGRSPASVWCDAVAGASVLRINIPHETVAACVRTFSVNERTNAIMLVRACIRVFFADSIDTI